MSQVTKPGLALFDFDGTVTKKDSLFTFLLFAIPAPIIIYKFTLLIPFTILYKLGLYSNYKFKKRILASFFLNWDQQYFKSICKKFCKTKLKDILKKQAIEKMEWHRSRNDRVIIISASIEELIKDWSEEMRVELIGTKMEFKDQKVSGNFSTANCYGKEKVRRLREVLNPDDYFIYCYGDSKSDHALLSICDEKNYKVFKK